MDKQSIVNNWEIYYKSYLKLNPDLVLSGINSKRALLNHFVKYGYDEGRPYNENESINLVNLTPQTHLQPTQVTINGRFYLEERMIIEKINL